MQFRTPNSPAEAQGYINTAISECQDDLESAYRDDMLRYTDSEEEHVVHIMWIMQRLFQEALYLKPAKCELRNKTVRYLWLSIPTPGICMDEDKIDTVQN